MPTRSSAPRAACKSSTLSLQDDVEEDIISSPPHHIFDRNPAKNSTVASRQKESHFRYKYGQRHHLYDSEKAPYPVSYDRQVLEIEAMATHFILRTISDVSFVKFDSPPKKTLDLGCGMGIWIIDAAKHWPDTHFVGFDLVNVQVPLSTLEPSIASRITWMHGNFLSTKLPFDDDEFDHVRMRHIARGVPEHKWGVLFEEISRVLQPGGAIESIEDDLVFPTLPRWFTSPLRVNARRAAVHVPDGTQPPKAPSTPLPSKDTPTHDHALLESLFTSVFESRFINLQPTSIVPVYLTMYFRKTWLSPQVSIRMPSVPPLQPLLPRVISSYTTSPSRDCTSVTPTSTSPRPISISFSTSLNGTTFSGDPKGSSSPANGAILGVRPKSASFSSVIGDISREASPNSTRPPSPPPPLFTTLAEHNDEKQQADPSLNWFEFDKSGTYGFTVRDSEGMKALLTERAMVMHLYCSYQCVLGCQEAMWDELKDRIRNRKKELIKFGWDDDEELQELRGRKRFERLMERYKSDILTRMALWCSLVGMGWPFPTREPLSKAEVIEEERIQQEMLRARQRPAGEEDDEEYCRVSRVLVGFKGHSD